jgi:hypothetical protein
MAHLRSQMDLTAFFVHNYGKLIAAIGGAAA